jgi:hypothetical protein
LCLTGFFKTSNDKLPFRMEIFASIFSSPFLAFLSACTVYLNINISSGFCSKTKSSMSTISSPTKLALIVSVLTNFAHLVMFSARCYLCSSGVNVSQIASSWALKSFNFCISSSDNSWTLSSFLPFFLSAPVTFRQQRNLH